MSIVHLPHTLHTNTPMVARAPFPPLVTYKQKGREFNVEVTNKLLAYQYSLNLA